MQGYQPQMLCASMRCSKAMPKGLTLCTGLQFVGLPHVWAMTSQFLV